MRRLRFEPGAVALVGAILIGCRSNRPPVAEAGTSSPPSEAGEDLTNRPGNVYRVRYRPTTVVLDRATTARSLRSVSTDGSVLVFDAAEPAVADLQPPKVLLLEWIAVRKVVAVARQGEYLAVRTEPASLVETIEDGEIRWRLPVRVGALARHLATRSSMGSPRLAAVWPVPPAPAPDGYRLNGTKNGWQYTMTATPAPQRVDLGVSLTKAVNGIEVALDATGSVPDFETLASLEIAGGILQRASYRTEGLSGEVQMTISAQAKGAPGDFGKKQVKLPAILKAPFFLGGLPFTLEISSAITFTPGLGAKNQIATAHFRLRYSDLAGFDLQGGGGPTGNGTAEGEGEILDFRGVSTAGIGVVAGVAMPRLEFKLGTASIVAVLKQAIPADLADALGRALFGAFGEALDTAEESIKTEGALHTQVVLVGSYLYSGLIALLPCQKTTFSFRADAGADATFVGQTAAEITVDLFRKEIVKTAPPNVTCG